MKLRPTDYCVTPREMIKERFATEDLVERSECEERQNRDDSVEISSVLTADATADIFTGGGAAIIPSFVWSVGHAVIGNFRRLSCQMSVASCELRGR